ncbi:MAG: helix-turn-helix domain-containing protein [Spirochaetaceae bacterium]|jgi:transcriptional regulator with XRE-family HTH domain|nr:helix-turn-helix domain-containing protein [Spirochaetaceae bacterium]
MIISIFGQNLKRIRMQKNISQMELAMRTDLTHNFINDIENGRKWVSSETMSRLANVLETEPYYFFITGPLESVNAGILGDYLTDVSDSFTRIVNDFRENYLSQTGDDSGEKEE